MIPPNKERHILTGATRGRVRLLSRKLILQVEVQEEIVPGMRTIPSPPPTGVSQSEWDKREAVRIEAAWRPTRRFWRDATWQDQLLLAQKANS